MKHRKLRIAWSVTWGIAAMLIIALWVRSYWYWEGVKLQKQKLGMVAKVYSVHYFMLLMAGIFSAVPWLPLTRFSLRTLLIAWTMAWGLACVLSSLRAGRALEF
jgi:hypothetical protein